MGATYGRSSREEIREAGGGAREMLRIEKEKKMSGNVGGKEGGGGEILNGRLRGTKSRTALHEVPLPKKKKKKNPYMVLIYNYKKEKKSIDPIYLMAKERESGGSGRRFSCSLSFSLLSSLSLPHFYIIYNYTTPFFWIICKKGKKRENFPKGRPFPTFSQAKTKAHPPPPKGLIK